jgi:hypothetical protein
MAQLDTAFIANQYPIQEDGFSPIPPGIYLAVISNSEIKQTKAGDGEYIKLEFKVVGGDYNGRMIWTNLHRKNPSVDAVEIGQKNLAKICRAVGKPAIENTCQLHDIPLKIKVKIERAKGDYPPQNKIVSYASENDGALPEMQAPVLPAGTGNLGDSFENAQRNW